MKWLSNVRDTYGYLSGALSGQQEARTTPVALDGTLVPRPVRDSVLKACRLGAQGPLIDGLSVVSVRSGANQMVTVGPDAYFTDLGSKDLNLVALSSPLDRPAVIHQAIFNRSDARAIVQTPGVFATIVAGQHRLPAGDMLDVSLDIGGMEKSGFSSGSGVLPADGVLVPRIGLITWGETLNECLRQATVIEHWCHISWIDRGLELESF